MTPDFLQALQKLKSELQPVHKDKTNPYFNSHYADINNFLDVVEPACEKHGFVLTQPLVCDNGQTMVQTIITHVDTGESVVSSLPFEMLADPQKVGSLITYYRRYTLQSALGMRADDDDANALVDKPKKPRKQRAPAKPKMDEPQLPNLVSDPQLRKLEVMARADELFNQSATVLYLFICKQAKYDVDEKADFATLKKTVRDRFSKQNASELIARITDNSFSEDAMSTLSEVKAICLANTQP